MSDTSLDMQQIRIKLHNIIKPYINDLALEGFIIINSKRKILKVEDRNYLVIDGAKHIFII